MHLEVDRGACKGYGNCLVNAEDYIDLDDEDIAIPLRDQIDPADLLRVTSAAESCPVAALRIAS